jgi:methylated-DNA-[protein]-cysteine S-methyltransferase
MEYFEGKRLSFDLPLKMEGTEFQLKVWNELLQIPFGETRSYKEIAVAVGNPLGSRAIGNANNKNKISIIVPCHRVIGANGKLVGYEGGLDVKEKLLNLEKKIIRDRLDPENKVESKVV